MAGRAIEALDALLARAEQAGDGVSVTSQESAEAGATFESELRSLVSGCE